MSTYGRPSSYSNPYFGWLDPGELRASVFNKITENAWVYELGIWAGKNTDVDPDNVTARLAIYDTDSSKDPDDRLGYTASFTVSNVMTDASGGQSKTASIAVSTGPSSASIPLQANQRYALAVLGVTGSLGHRMQAAANISADNERFYTRDGLTQPPPDPFGTGTETTEGHMTIWATYEANVAPDTPTNLVPSGSINDTAPTFTADFSDSNEDQGDYLNQFKIQVRRVSDQTSFWDTTLTATSAEQAADAISRAYGGTTLVRGTAYEWRCQMSDYFGAWSDWTAWEDFTPANLGYVTLEDDPTGKIEDNTPDFEGKWTHQSSTSMKTCMVRILNGTGTTVLQTGSDFNIADVSSSASPGTLFTIAWADTGLSDLAWGTSYQYQIRGYDGTQWSDWSSARTFSTDAAPSVPVLVSPTNGQILTDYPELSCTCTDSDDDTGTGFVVYARIKDSAGTVLKTRAMTYDSGSGRWEYQTVVGANEVQVVTITGSPTGGTFTLTYSGQTTAGINYNANAAAVQAALEALSNIAVGDVVCTGGSLPGTAVTCTFGGALGLTNLSEMTASGAGLTGGSSPAVAISTTTAGVDGDIASYATYRWDAYGYDGTLYSGEASSSTDATKSSESTFVYALGPTVTITAPSSSTVTTASLLVQWTTTSQVKYRIYLYDETGDTLIYDSGVVVSGTSSATIPSGYYHNDTSYQLIVWVEDSTPLSGESSAMLLDVDYVEPDAVTNFAALAVPIGNDPNGWTTAIRLTWDPTDYGTDVWQRYEITRSAASGVDASEILWAQITSPIQTAITDYTPVNDVEYTYTIRQIILTGLDELESEAVTALETAEFGGVVLADVSDPDALRSALRYTQERPHSFDRDETIYQPLSGAKPTTVRSRTYAWATDYKAKLVDDEWSTAAEKRAELMRLDANLGTLCHRNEKGDKYFCTMPRCDISDQLGDWYEARIVNREEKYTEGV